MRHRAKKVTNKQRILHLEQLRDKTSKDLELDMSRITKLENDLIYKDTVIKLLTNRIDQLNAEAKDQKLREKAIDYALKSFAYSSPTVLKHVETFYSYLKGDEQQPSQKATDKKPEQRTPLFSMNEDGSLAYNE